MRPRGTLLTFANAAILVILAADCGDAAQCDEPVTTPTAAPATDLYGDPLPAHAVGRLGTIRFLPRSATLSQAVCSPDGKLIATAASIFVGASKPGIQVWDRQSGREVGSAELSDRAVRQLAWSPDSRRIAVCFGTELIEIWDVTRRERIGKRSDRYSTYGCVAWSSDGKWIAAGQQHGPLTVFDAVTLQVVKSIDKHATCLVFSRDAKSLAVCADSRLAIFDVTGGKLLAKLEFDAGSGRAFSLAFAPDGQSVAIAGEKTVLVDLSGTQPHAAALTDDSKEVSSFSVAIGPDGRQLATSGFSHARSWDLRTKTVMHQFPALSQMPVDFTPDGKDVVLVGRRIIFADAKSGAQRDPYPCHGGSILGFAMTPDGKSVYTVAVEPTVRQWDVSSTRSARELKLPSGTSRAIAISRDAAVLAVASDSVINLFDTTTGRISRKLEAHKATVESVVFSPTENLLVSRSSDGMVRYWDSTTWQTLGTIEPDRPKSYLGYSAFTTDGKILALVTPTDSVIELFDPASRKPLRTSRIHDQMVSMFLPVCFSPDGKSLALLTVSPDPNDADRISCYFDVQETQTGKAIRQLRGEFNYPSAIACDPRGKLVAIADMGDSLKNRPDAIHIYSLTTGKPLMQFKGHVDTIRQLKFSPDGTRLFSASQDTTVLVWSLDAARAALAEKTGM